MIGKVKSKIASWLIGRGVEKLLRNANVNKPQERQATRAIKKAISNIMQNKPTLKNEPVVYGGMITVAVALAGAFGLELTNEQLAVTVSTVIAIVSFIQRRVVSPTHKNEN